MTFSLCSSISSTSPINIYYCTEKRTSHLKTISCCDECVACFVACWLALADGIMRVVILCVVHGPTPTLSCIVYIKCVKQTKQTINSTLLIKHRDDLVWCGGATGNTYDQDARTERNVSDSVYFLKVYCIVYIKYIW